MSLRLEITEWFKTLMWEVRVLFYFFIAISYNNFVIWIKNKRVNSSEWVFSLASVKQNWGLRFLILVFIFKSSCNLLIFEYVRHKLCRKLSKIFVPVKFILRGLDWKKGLVFSFLFKSLRVSIRRFQWYFYVFFEFQSLVCMGIWLWRHGVPRFKKCILS